MGQCGLDLETCAEVLHTALVRLPGGNDVHEVGGGKLLSSADILPRDPMLSLKARYIWFRLQPVLELGVLAV